jgi:DNA-binding NarL/FixJ family response regulator
MPPVQVRIQAADAINRAGVAELLHASPVVQLIEDDQPAAVEVILLVTETVTIADLEQLRRIRDQYDDQLPPRCLIVTGQFDPALTMTAVKCGVMCVLPRTAITSTRLTSAILSTVEGAAHLPARLQRALLDQLDDLRRTVLEPNGFTLSGLADRELDVLGLLAEGLPIDEIALKVSYSEGTVKNLLYGVIDRLGLNNRAHAVAYAIRTGAL